MSTKTAALLFGIGVGFLIAWARLTDPAVIRSMLLLREAHVFLLMGSAVCVAAVGARLLRAKRARAILAGELIQWQVEKPEARHVVGSLLFGAGWSIAGTCPGPMAAMLGEGRLSGLVVTAGLVGGVVLQGAVAQRRTAKATARPAEVPDVAGL